MKKIPVLLAGTLVLGGILAYTFWQTANRTPQAYFDSGKKNYDQKQYPEAVIEFLNALRKDAHHRDSRYFLALSYLNLQDLASAIKHLKALLEVYPDDTAANLQLGGIYLAGGRTNPQYFREARELAKRVLSKEPQNVTALVLSGNAAAGLQDYGSSVELFEKAITLDPQNSTAFVSLGTSQVLQKNYPEAEKAFLKARDTNPKDKSVLISLGNYYRSAGESGKAEAVLKDALSEYPADKDVYSQVVSFYFGARRFDDVEKVLRGAQAGNATDPSPTLILVNLYEVTGRAADARKLLLEAKSKFPNSLDLAARFAMNLIQDQPEQAQPEIDQILKAEPKNPLGYVLLGELQFRTGQFDAAEATLGKDPALNSRFPQPHFLLGSLAARKGQLDQAQDHYQKSLAVDSRYLPARVALAETFLNKGKFDDAREEIRKTLDAQPLNAPARMLKATLDTIDKKYPEAEREFAGLVKENPDNPGVLRQAGLYYDSRGKKVEAEKSLVHALELAPNSEQSFRDLILFFLRGKQADRAIQKLNGVPDAQKKAFHYELAGIIGLQTGKLQDSENAFKKALEKDPNRSSSEQLLFRQYTQTGRLDDAMKILDERIKKNPSDSGVLAMKGTVYEIQGKSGEAKKHYVEALKGDPNLDIAANNLAYILAEEGQDLQTALGWAQGVRKRHPEDPSFADTLAWVYYKLGRQVLAKEQAQFAASKQPGNGVFQYHLALIYKANNQISEAESALKKVLASPQKFKEKSLADAALKDINHWRHLVN